MITVKISNLDKSNLIKIESFSITDNINDKKNTCDFSILMHSGQTYEPSVGEVIDILDGTTNIFSGVILSIEKNIDTQLGVRLSIKCTDLSHFLDRQLVLERYLGKTGQEIIEEMIVKYAPAFTTTNVVCTTVIDSIVFDRQPVSECLQILAEALNYSWYVDYDFDIHFFENNSEPAPFDLTETSENYIYNSLSFSDDLSQLRNRITIRGGEEEGNDITEEFTASGDLEERKFYRIAHKFARLPIVLVNSTPQTVGVDFLDSEDDFNCFWSYEQKYIRFKDATAPSATDIVEITGTPLYPIVITRSDSTSISTYGVYEFYEENRSINSRDQALEFGLAKLEAYKNSIKEGGFDTRTSGLKSGQIININIPSVGVNEDFIIQSVKARLINPETFLYSISLATLRTVGIIKVLQNLLRKRDIKQDISELILSFQMLEDEFGITDELTSIDPQTGPYVYDTAEYGFATWA